MTDDNTTMQQLTQAIASLTAMVKNLSAKVAHLESWEFSATNNKKNDNPSPSKQVGGIYKPPEIYRARRNRPSRYYTPIGMSYAETFERLMMQGAISPIGPTEDMPVKKRGPNWSPNYWCKYHRGKGHTTEQCWSLKDRIQPMIDDGRFLVSAATEKPNNQDSPLKEALATEKNKALINSSSFTTCIHEPLPLIVGISLQCMPHTVTPPGDEYSEKSGLMIDEDPVLLHPSMLMAKDVEIEAAGLSTTIEDQQRQDATRLHKL